MKNIKWIVKNSVCEYCGGRGLCYECGVTE